MDVRLTPADADVLDRARSFARSHLFPYEEHLDEHDSLPAAVERDIHDAVLSHGLNAINHSPAHGGQGMTLVQQCIVNEEVGASTGALWARVWQPPICLAQGTQEQVERYLEPACGGRILIAFSTTEPDAGSDAGGIKTTARAEGDGYVLNGEKCYASMAGVADVTLLTAIVEGRRDAPTLFIVDRETPGFDLRRSPRFSLRDGLGHPEIDIRDMQLPKDRILGAVGEGFELTKDWFVEARMAIAARSVGMAVRALELALDHARTRRQFDRAIIDFQGIEFRLADMTARTMAAKSLVYRVAAEIDAMADRRTAHAKASAAKLFSSEAAIRTVDEASQIFGGRSVMCEHPIERLVRDVRLERIWEGTSDIHRVVIGGQLRKRGTEPYTGWLRSDG